jgi:hypothetical protein
MRNIPILPQTNDPSCCLGNEYLPLNYMGEFSLLGFRVQDVPEAIRILTEYRYPVRSTPCGAEVTVNDVNQLSEIIRLFHSRQFDFSLSDVADHIYRG